MPRKEMTIKRNFQKLRESPGVRYESVGRGFESLPSHQEKPVHIVCWFFFFCLRDGRGSNRAAAHSAASNQPSGLLLSPRVPTRRNVYRGSCRSKDFMAFLFCKPWVHGFCTVGVFHVRLCRALYCIAISALFLHQVSRVGRSFAFISGSASFSNSKRAVMEMVGSPAADS